MNAKVAVRANNDAFNSGLNYTENKAKEIGLAMDEEDLLMKHDIYLSSTMTLRACFPEREETIRRVDDWEWSLFMARLNFFKEREENR